MGQFVEKNRSLLSFCSRSVQFCGWILLALYAVLASSLVSQLVTSEKNIAPLALTTVIVSALLPCLIVLGTGQFIAYVLDNKGKLGFLLNYSNIILFLYAALLTLNMVLFQVKLFKTSWPLSNTEIPWAKFLLVSLGAFLPDFVKILLLFTVGLLIKQVIASFKISKSMPVEIETPGPDESCYHRI